tara:strand:+ start:1651 stop:1893 length:243 start_codon:yes stop_codon:yes gene_type:complete
MEDIQTKLTITGTNSVVDDMQRMHRISPISSDIKHEYHDLAVTGSDIISTNEGFQDNRHLRIHIQRANMLYLDLCSKASA